MSLRHHWNTPVELCPPKLNTQLLADIREGVKSLEPTWKHRWPHSLSALKLLTSDGHLPNTWKKRFETVLHANNLEWERELVTRISVALVKTRKESLLTASGKRWKFSTWNVNGLSPQGHLRNEEKIKCVQRLVQDSIVVLTETKWDDGDQTRLMLQYGGSTIIHTPAIRTETNGKSGGVAIIIPTHTWGKNIQVEVIMHGYVIMLTLQHFDITLVIIGVYAPPGKERNVLKTIHARVATLPLRSTLFVLGDLNQTPKLGQAWENFLAETLLVDCTPNGLPTFWTGGGKPPSTLDRFLCRHNGIECGTHACKVRASNLRPRKQEHAKVFAVCAPVNYEKTSLPAAPVIPAKAFTSAYKPSQELARRIARIEGISTQNTLDKIRATTWHWWKSQPKSMFQEISSDIEKLHNTVQQRGTYVEVKLRVYRLLCAQLGQTPDCEPATDRLNCIIPRNHLIHLLEMKSLQAAQNVNFRNMDSTVRKIHWVKGPSPIWARLKTMDPKNAAFLSALFDEQGILRTDPISIDKAVRSTRGFWLEETTPLNDDLLQLLGEEYSEQSPSLGELQPPDGKAYQAVVITSKDTSPGLDGIPYALYRLVPGITVQLLEDMLIDITSRRHTVRVPNPMLVWIPKAVAGQHADCWRPLGMAPTFHRLLAGGIYYHVVAQITRLLHPSQALLNNFREPQHNFLVAHDFLQQKKRIRPDFFEGVLVTDFVKAFELVNPYWIIAVLRTRGAPNWLLQYVEFTLFGRIISPKIRNLILPGLRVKVGVDMGSPLSPLFFCLALDPLLVALNRIPRVYSVRAYMDDNQSAVQSMQALVLTQAAYDLVHTAGLQVTQHTCCTFALEGSVSFPIGYPSWRSAARKCLRISASSGPEVKYSAKDSDKLFTRLQLQAIADGHPGPVLTRLVLQKCGCKTKTAFLPAFPLTHAQIAHMDGTRWGAKILSKETTVLGLPLRAAYSSIVRRPGNRKIPLTVASFDGAFAKAMLKVATRSTKLRGSITPVPQLALAFPAWIQSTMYYAASVFQPSNNILQKVLGYFSKTVLGRNWIAKDCVQGVFSAIGIAAGLPLRDSLKLAHLGFCMRRDTPEVVMLSPATAARKQLDQIIAYYRDTLPVELFERFRDTCVSIRSSRPKDVVPVLGLLRKFIKQAVSLQGTRYLRTRTARIIWLPRRCHQQLDNTWQLLQDLPNAQLGPYVRLGMSRWLLDSEPDEGLYWHTVGLHRTGTKCQCCDEHGQHIHETDALWYPHGFGHQPMHIDHFTRGAGWQAIADAQVQSYILSKLPSTERASFTELSSAPIAHGVRAPLLPDTVARPFCPLCGYGESSVHHWIVFCPIVNGILAILLARAKIGIEDWLPNTHKQLIIVGHCIFHIRRELLALNAFGHGKFQDPIVVPVETRHTLMEKLLQTITHSLPFFISCNLSQTFLGSLDLPFCASEHVNFAALLPAQLKTNLLPRKLARNCVIISKQIEPAQTQLLLTHNLDFCATGIRTEYGWLPPPRRVSPGDASASIGKRNCICGRGDVIVLTTTRVIGKGGEITLPKTSGHGKSQMLVFAFDGSTRDPTSSSPSSGCGIYGWQILDQQINVVYQASIPLPNASNSFEAEALAAAHTIQAIHQCIGQYPNHCVEIQGDNSSIVQFWKGEARLSSLKIHELCQEATNTIRYHLPHIEWNYIPRECNKFADYLAGLASKAVQDSKAGAGPAVPIYDALPTSLEESAVAAHHALGIRLLSTPGAINKVEVFEKLDFGVWPEIFKAVASSKTVLTKFNDITSLYERSQLHHRNWAIKVRYTDKADGPDAPFGRLYAYTPSATNCGKTGRVLLAHDSHVELDIQGSHFGIWLSLVLAQGNLIPEGWFTTVDEHRTYIMQCLTSPAATLACKNLHGDTYNSPIEHPLLQSLPKYLPIRVLNKGKSSVMKEIRTALFFVPQALETYIDTLILTHDKLIAADALPSVLDERVTWRNDTYFALERIEGVFMHVMIGTILTASKIESVFFVHDGVYIAPAPDPDLVQRAIQTARLAIGGFDLVVKVTPISLLKEQCRRDLLKHPQHDRPPRKNELPYAVIAAARTAKNLAHAAPPPEVEKQEGLYEDRHTLHRFINRKLTGTLKGKVIEVD